MLDPVTIATGVGALLKSACSIIAELKAFGDGVAIVKDKLNGLLQDVEDLTLVLTSMRHTFEGITAGVGTDQIGNHWQNISRALENGKETLAQLRACLKDVNKTSRLFDTPTKQLRLNAAADRISLFREHVQSYRDALQLSLQTVILWTQVSQKQTTDLILPSLNNLHEEVRRVANILNKRIGTLHDMIVSQAPKVSQRDSQWQDESQMVAMCILRDCIHSAVTVVSSASSKLGSDPGARVSTPAADSDLGDVFPRRSRVMLQRYIDSVTNHEYAPGSSLPELRSLASVPPFESGPIDYPDSDDDLEAEITTSLLYKARRILLAGAETPSEQSRAERYIKACLSRLSGTRLSGTNSVASGDKVAENRSLEIQALELLVSIYCNNSQWGDAQSMLMKKMAVKERFCSKDDSSLVADVLLLARVLLASHGYVEAFPHARRALKAYRKIGHAEGCSESLHVLVCICRSSNREDEAEAYEALLTELYQDGTVSLRKGSIDSSVRTPKSETFGVSLGNQTNNDTVPIPEQAPESSTSTAISNRKLTNFSYNRQQNLSDVISNAKAAANLSNAPTGVIRNRKPKLIPRGANEREPILKLPPSPPLTPSDDGEGTAQQRQKPKLIPRGANEREPIIELPPFPAEEEEQSNPNLRGVDGHETVVESPSAPEEQKHLPWDPARFWPKRIKANRTAKRKPSLQIESKPLLGGEIEVRPPESHSENSLNDSREVHTKNVDILAERPPEQMARISAAHSIRHPYVRPAVASTYSTRDSRTSTISRALRNSRISMASHASEKSETSTIRRAPARSPDNRDMRTTEGQSTSSQAKHKSKPILSLYDDQWLRGNRAWLMELMKFTESDTILQSRLNSTSDLLSTFSFNASYAQRNSPYAASIVSSAVASSEALSPSLRMIHPALRPGYEPEAWI
ncbi:MAG: hypothetical protein Q9165_003343 [Trypethelium subeluteriae]